MRPSARLAVTLTALLGMPGLALAQHAAKANPKDKDVAADAAQVAVDPKTHELRQPTREEVEELLEAMKPYLDQSSEGLTPVTYPDGTIGLDLQDRFQSVSVARVDSDEVHARCVTTPDEARAFLAGPRAKPEPKPATPALEEK